jgi:hypothetical protein
VTRCVMDLSIYVHYPADRPTDPKSHFLDHFVAKIVGCWVRWSPKHGGMPFLDTLSLFPKVPTHMESPPCTKRVKTWNFGGFANFSKVNSLCALPCRPVYGPKISIFGPFCCQNCWVVVQMVAQTRGNTVSRHAEFISEGPNPYGVTPTHQKGENMEFWRIREFFQGKFPMCNTL